MSLFGGQKTKSTTTIQVPPPSAGEQEAQQISLALSKEQLEEFRRAKTEREAFAASPQAASQKRLEALATENLLARLEGRAPVLSPEAQQRVGTAFGAAKTRGLEDLTRLANETAAMRGMTRADSPIAAPFLQESGRFLQGLEGTRAQSELDVGQTEALFNQSLAEFQSRLQQQAFLNRMSLATGTVAPQAGLLAQGLFAQRLAAAPRSQITRGPFDVSGTLTGFGQFAGGTGGLLRGLSGYGGGAASAGYNVPSSYAAGLDLAYGGLGG